MGMWGGHVDDEGAEVEGDQQGNKGGRWEYKGTGGRVKERSGLGNRAYC